MDLVDAVYIYVEENGLRDLPWRASVSPYTTLVSEVMLQQTQARRVAPKFEVFVRELSDFTALASASGREVLSLWSGLGYNRRALMLQETAKLVISSHNSVLPDDEETLCSFPGIGPYTAAAICAFAYNKPAVVVETNIRTAVIEHCFPQRSEKVPDTEVREVVADTLKDKRVRGNGARFWYSALMDYGAHLKETGTSHNARTAGYTKQSAFEGSFRSVRSALVRALLEKEGGSTLKQLCRSVPDERVPTALDSLVKDGLVVLERTRYAIK